MISRRKFLAGSSLLALRAALPHKAVAILHRGAALSGGGQSVVNAGSSALAFINLAHGMVLVSSQANFPNNFTADGYPNDPVGTAITSSINDNNSNNWDSTYYGRYRIWWTGTAAFEFNGQPAIVYSGGTSANGVDPSSSGTAQSNFTIGAGTSTQPTQSTPVEFAFGALITGVSGGNGSLVTISHTSVLFGSGFQTGSWIKLSNGVSGNLSSGPNFDGSWQITNVSGTSFTLNNSTGVVSPTVTGSGGAGTQSEALLRVGNLGNGPAMGFPAGRIYSGFSGMVICKSADVTAVLAGQLVSQPYVSAFKSPGMNPVYIRVMDFTAVQGDRSSSYTYRAQTSNLCWGPTHFVKDYFVGTATNTGAAGGFSDVYTCSNPTASGSGAYADGEQVAVLLGATNTGVKPALNVNGRGSAPILTQQADSCGVQLAAFLTGSVPTLGSVQTLVFSGAGLGSPYTLHYTTTSADSSFGNLGGDLAHAVRMDTTLSAAGIFALFFGNPASNLAFSYNPNVGGLGNSPLVVTGTDASGHTTYSFGTCAPGALAASYCTFCYSKLIGAWISSTDGNSSNASAAYGPHNGPPLEFYIDFCNRTGCGLYLNIGQMWSASRISSTVTLIAQNLNSGLKLKLAYANETWNGNAQELSLAAALGNCIGCTDDNGGGGFFSLLNLTGLRTAQISALAAAAWTGAGRSRSDLRIQMEFNFTGVRSTSNVQYPTSFVTNQFNGAGLNPASNTTLANFGAIGVGTVSTNFSASPNRPIDFSDDIGGAPYFAGAQCNAGGSNGISSGLALQDYSGASITISAYNQLLLASWNYANGNSTQKSAALDFLYNENSGPAGDFYNGSLNGTYSNNWQLASWETTSSDATSPGTFGVGSVIQSYDASRATAGLSQLGYVCYEGSLQAGPLSGDISNLITSLNNLGDTAGYTSSLPGAASGSSTVAGDAANIQALLLAFQGDNRYKLLTERYLTICQQSGRWVSGSTFVNSRTSMGTTYGFEGPGYWSLYFGLLGAVPQPMQAVGGVTAFNN